MQIQIDDFEVTLPEGCSAELVKTVENGSETLSVFSFRWNGECAASDGHFRVRFTFPALSMLYFWAPLEGKNRSVKPDWLGPDQASMISCNAPVHALFDGEGNARFVWQLSECRMLTFIHTGVLEESGRIEAYFEFGTRQFTGKHETEITLRTDRSVRPLCEALKRAADWWADDLHMTPAYVPEAALDATYSFWYSFHQEVYEKDVEEECRRAKALGFSSCIIDDGWQTADNSRGYAYCGDWEPAAEKIPDMAAHVKRVHDIGMKYILWYSVPLVGYRSKHYETFQDKMLTDDPRLNCSVLDPRYREVRDFLTGIYLKALKDWDLDGFKLDFIDRWKYSPDNAPYSPEMDIPSLEYASYTFMKELTEKLKAVKPDILLEFRQGYIGPHMREYGNMFRVGDCPDDYIANRAGIFDLRMMMGQSAVHSDMLMWHKDEKPELAALQLISVLFGVIQYSARLSEQSEENLKMSRFWLDFSRDHKETLLKGELRPCEPQHAYTSAQAVSDNETVAAVYAIDKCIAPEARDTIYIANGSQGKRVLAELSGAFRVTVQDCMGNTVSEKEETFAGIAPVSVPVGGLITLTRKQ